MNRNACRVLRKIKLLDKLYVFTPVETLMDVQLDNDKNVIYDKEGIIIHEYVNKEFLESGEVFYYADFVTNHSAEILFVGGKNFEEQVKNYTEVLNQSFEVIYYSKDLKDYVNDSLNIEELDKVIKYHNATSKFQGVDSFIGEVACLIDDEIIIKKSLHEKLTKAANEGNIEYIQKIFKVLEQAYAVMPKDFPSVSMIIPNISMESSKKISIGNKVELDSLVGLNKIKNQVKKLSDYLKFRQKTSNYINFDRLDLNMVYTGNPGTGKTTVARIISQILNKLGFANDKVLECTSTDFIAEYVGHTQLKTQKLISKAKGGVIFIDEAYSFASEGNKFANEAISEILKEMETNQTIFIFAGYKKEMDHFIKMNSGLASRIGYYFDFPDYSPIELLEIFERKVNMSKMILDENCKLKVLNVLELAQKTENFGNGRFVNKLFSYILMQHACNTMDSQDKEKLITITESDIPNDVLEQILYTNESNETKKIKGFVRNNID